MKKTDILILTLSKSGGSGDVGGRGGWEDGGVSCSSSLGLPVGAVVVKGLTELGGGATGRRNTTG